VVGVAPEAAPLNSLCDFGKEFQIKVEPGRLTTEAM
jgi:hypothetical protein